MNKQTTLVFRDPIAYLIQFVQGSPHEIPANSAYGTVLVDDLGVPLVPAAEQAVNSHSHIYIYISIHRMARQAGSNPNTQLESNNELTMAC